MDQHQTITLEVEDKPGVLSRISTLFSRRGYNIESLTVGHTHIPGISRFTIVVTGDEAILEQIRKQSQKLIHVLKTENLDKSQAVMREFAIVKLKYSGEHIPKINELVDLYGARMLDSRNEVLIVEFSGTEEKIEMVFNDLKQFKVLESIRTGKLAMRTGQ
ncbi:MAG: acetolactate synthase small subunit [Deltaproteobacteria bacterium]|jgi:acetolactate synthase I/III small subunit|nr:acetolactate synthase small subunit [Deltaproteobacteria bacterium]MBT4527458.1 acetolactate synthase small subunit [Deltaproteobacteria bacterium]